MAVAACENAASPAKAIVVSYRGTPKKTSEIHDAVSASAIETAHNPGINVYQAQKAIDMSLTGSFTRQP